MKRGLVAGLFVLALMGTANVQAQTPFDAEWVWYNAGNPAEKAPEGKVWFRREVRSAQPSTGSARIICDDSFVLWVNGKRVGAGAGDEREALEHGTRVSRPRPRPDPRAPLPAARSRTSSRRQ